MATKSSYHHGDLRRALIDGAVELVREHGLRGWTLRGVARKVGVSHAAPYHHFADLEALLGAVTAHGFELLVDSLQAALSPAPASPRERLLVMARTYLQFGAANPGLYQVMFREVRSPSEGTDAGRVAGIDAMDLLVSEFASAGLAGSGDPRVLFLPAWSMLHGFIGLAVLGPLPRMGLLEGASDEVAEGIAEAAVSMVLP